MHAPRPSRPAPYARLLAIDPGPTHSAILHYNPTTGIPDWWAKDENAKVLLRLREWANKRSDVLAIEQIRSYGMSVGAETFDTVYESGRFAQAWVDTGGWEPIMIPRQDVKLHLCHSPRAKDSNVRQALIDRWGGKERAVGRKANPGPLYGLSGDCWAALGVAVTVGDTILEEAA